MSGGQRRRRRGPNWTVVVIFLGVGLGAIILGIYQLTRPTIVETQAQDGIVAIRNWNPPPGTELEGDPEFTELDDGTVQLTATYVGQGPIDPAEAEFFCQTLSMPPTWSLVGCEIPPDRPNALAVTIQR